MSWTKRYFELVSEGMEASAAAHLVYAERMRAEGRWLRWLCAELRAMLRALRGGIGGLVFLAFVLLIALMDLR